MSHQIANGSGIDEFFYAQRERILCAMERKYVSHKLLIPGGRKLAMMYVICHRTRPRCVDFAFIPLHRNLSFLLRVNSVPCHTVLYIKCSTFQ